MTCSVCGRADLTDVTHRVERWQRVFGVPAVEA